jgi:hypothetical protein
MNIAINKSIRLLVRLIADPSFLSDSIADPRARPRSSAGRRAIPPVSELRLPSS